MKTDGGSPAPPVVAVAASAGGVEALSKFVALLPEDFPACVLVVLHISPVGTSVLPRILSRAGKLPARHPQGEEPLLPGTIFVAPPDRHLVVADHRADLRAGPRQNGHRPSADALLRSVAEQIGRRGAGVVLSGTMDDGAAGLRAVGAVGGLTLVQDPEEAAFPGMPRAAIEEATPGLVGPVNVLVEHLVRWAKTTQADPEGVEVDTPTTFDPSEHDEVTPFTCPECGGTLWSHEEYGAQRFRCRVGHGFSSDGLLLGKKDALESALWAAVVALEEQADLYGRLSDRLGAGARPTQTSRYERRTNASRQQAHYLRELIHELLADPMSDDEGSDGDADSTA